MDGIEGRLKEVRLKAPVVPEDLARLELGNVVYLDGLIYTGREGVYRKVVDEGARPPAEVLAEIGGHEVPPPTPRFLV